MDVVRYQCEIEKQKKEIANGIFFYFTCTIAHEYIQIKGVHTQHGYTNIQVNI